MSRDDPAPSVASVSSRAGPRAALAGAVLAGVWGVAFVSDLLPFFPTIVVGGALTGVAGVWVRRGSRGRHGGGAHRRRFPTLRVTPGQAGLAVAVAVLHAAVAHVLFAIGARILPTLTDTAADVYDRAGSLPLWAAVLLGGAITAPLEEVYWRGAVQPLVVSAVRDRWATSRYVTAAPLAASALVYTLFHVTTGQVALVAAALLGGVVWTWLLHRTGSVGATMIAHGVWTSLMLSVPPV